MNICNNKIMNVIKNIGGNEINCDNKFDNEFTKFTKCKIEPIIESIFYFIGIFIIISSAFYSIYLYFYNKKNNKDQEDIVIDMRIAISNGIGLGLAFILCGEIIKTYRIPNIIQLIKITTIVLLRQLIVYFADTEIKDLKNRKK